jgi:hypothetical protein
LNSPVTHWGGRAWQRNQDVLVPDPAHPLAFPGKCPTDLMGRIRVWLSAEDGNLVAHGFGGQRVVLPSASVGAVHTVSSYLSGGRTRDRSLLVLDHDNRILLRANGSWQTYGEVAAVCRAAGAPAPTHLTSPVNYRARGRAGRRSRRADARRLPVFEKARGCRRLRTRPRGLFLRRAALAVLFLLTVGLGVFIGLLPAVLMPEWTGAVRTLIGIVGALLGATAGCLAGAAIAGALVGALRWAVISLTLRTPAPPGRFFRRRARAGGPLVANVGLVLLVPALIAWGPGVGIASLMHGFRDASLVAELRAAGVKTPGLLIDVQRFSADDNGNTTVTNVPTLSFLIWKATDPSIGGRPLPLDPADPLHTRDPETVVWLPSNPQVAAAAQQLSGSVWHGAPTANLISGGLLTLALPPLLWFLVLRLLRRRGPPGRHQAGGR